MKSNMIGNITYSIKRHSKWQIGSNQRKSEKSHLKWQIGCNQKIYNKANCTKIARPKSAEDDEQHINYRDVESAIL